MRLWTRSAILAGLVVAAPGGLEAASFPIRPIDGLHGLIVHEILEDSRGHIWLATDIGPFRSEGQRFIPVQPQRLGQRVFALVEDRGVMWVGTISGAVAVSVDPPFEPQGDPVLTGAWIHALHRDGRGRVWFGATGGLYMLDRSTGQAVVVPGSADWLIESIAENKHGLWAGAAGGLLRIDQGRAEPFLKEVFGNHEVEALLADGDEGLWIGARRKPGLFHLLGNEVTRLQVPDVPCDQVNMLLPDPGGGVWVGTEEGIFRWRGRVDVVLDRASGLENIDIHSLCLDREGQLWIGTFGGGVYCMPTPPIRYYSLPDGLPHPLVTSMVPRGNGTLVLGTISGAVEFDIASARVNRLKPEFHVESVHLARDGSVWLGGPVGFARAGDADFRRDLGVINAVYEDDEGRILLGTQQGLWVLSGDQLTLVALPAQLRTMNVAALCRTDDGALWAATSAGLARHAGGAWETVDPAAVSALCPRPGGLWAGAGSRILFVTRERLGWEEIPARFGVHEIRGLSAGEDGTLWAATDAGLIRREGGQWAQLGLIDGLPVNLRCVLRLNESLFAGTCRGLVRIDEPCLPCPSPPRLGIEQLWAGGVLLPGNPAAIHLDYDDPYFVLNLRCEGWRSAQGVSLRHRLEGLQPDWSALSPNGMVQYTNLQPGRYRLVAQAVNAHGAQSDEFSIAVEVAAPFWVQPWFHLSVALLLLGIVLAATLAARRRAGLVRSLRAAENAQRMFVSRMSHEIRNPLAAILAWSELLEKSGASDNQAECVSAIRRNGMHLLELVNSVLDISKNQAGHLQVEATLCDLDELLSGIEVLAVQQAQNKRLEVEVHVDADVPQRVMLDVPKTRQMLINLVSNAIKFTPRGSVRIRASVQASALQPTLAFIVEDTGIGIPTDQQKAIFEPFQQLRTAGSDSMINRGSGLGLSISKALAEAMHGTIRVQSAPGMGSTFTVELPLIVGPQPEVTLTPQQVPLREPALDALLVWLVEDAEDVRRILTLVLERAGARVRSLTCASELLTAIESGAAAGDPAGTGNTEYPDVTLLDLRLPDGNGADLARELRRRGMQWPLIALTADVLAAAGKPAPDCFDRVLTKPFVPADVIRTIAEVAARTGGSLPAAKSNGPAADEPVNTGFGPILPAWYEGSPKLPAVTIGFARSLAGRIEQLQRAAVACDWAAAGEIAHRLCGSGGISGYMCISHAARRLTQDLRQGRHDTIAGHLETLGDLQRRILDGLPLIQEPEFLADPDYQSDLARLSR